MPKRKSKPPPDDPLDLKKVDQEIRIEKLKEQIKEVAGEEFVSSKADDCEPELEEAFLENVLALESSGWVRPLDVLVKEGLKLPPAEELDDAALEKKLWELIGAMAKHRLSLSC